MARIQFTIRSSKEPGKLLAALVDFCPARPSLWPAIDADVYHVHGVGDTWADVVEGSAVMGGIWARERYDWATAGVVRPASNSRTSGGPHPRSPGWKRVES